ncbi:unnamed protein product, partial [Mesorhabditis belari]|uniref:MARVEL domain-containing protein n=1 Tax=Mesorhabditis belari TaxID=2138241 RepID=A0AAF3J4T8_9BILA
MTNSNPNSTPSQSSASYIQRIISPHGLLSLIAMVLTFTLNILTVTRWDITYYGWQLLYWPLFALMFIYSLCYFLVILLGLDIFEKLGKMVMLVSLGVVVGCLIITGCILIDYASKANRWYDTRYDVRFILACILNWIVFLVYIVLSVLTFTNK